ncbi:MAG: IPT/TIG domain-containing protein [Methanoregula sp.]
MKRFTRVVCFILLLLLLNVAVPATAAGITKISPKVGYTDSYTTVTITGSGFNTTTGAVKLTMVGESNITTSTITTWTDTQIVCKLKTSGQATGDWKLVVINADGSEIYMPDGFTLQDPMVLTSISPTEAQVNNESVGFTLAGTGLSDVEDVYLYSVDDTNITADNVDAVSSEKVKGTFDLTDATEDTYDVCVKDSIGTTVCDLSFKILTDVFGSIYFETNPDGATVYLNSTKVGTSTFTYGNATPGTYKVLVQKDGYKDYGGYVTVIENKRTVFYARLTPLGEYTTAATTAAAATATPVKTATTIKKSTLKVPTTWPSDTPTTAASPVDPAIVLGAAAVGAGIFVTRRR